MYLPKNTQINNKLFAQDLIREKPLGLLFSNLQGRVEINSYPFISQEINDDLYLFTHIAKSNRQWQTLTGEVVICFQGPQYYISPTIYKNLFNVPTWNYVALQVFGKAQLITEAKPLSYLLEESVLIFESANQTDWTYELPEKMKQQLERAIVGVKIKVDRLELKCKISQNKGASDYSDVREFFKHNETEQGKEMYKWMLKVDGCDD